MNLEGLESIPIARVQLERRSEFLLRAGRMSLLQFNQAKVPVQRLRLRAFVFLNGHSLIRGSSADYYERRKTSPEGEARWRDSEGNGIVGGSVGGRIGFNGAVQLSDPYGADLPARRGIPLENPVSQVSVRTSSLQMARRNGIQETVIQGDRLDLAPPTSRNNEVQFCSDVSKWADKLFETNSGLPFRSSNIESFGRGSQERQDFRVYERKAEGRGRLALCGEVKLPGSAQGRSPFDMALLEHTFKKATRENCQYFFTWNVEHLALFDRSLWDSESMHERCIGQWKLGMELNQPPDVTRQDSSQSRTLARWRVFWHQVKHSSFWRMAIQFRARVVGLLRA